MKQKEKRTVKAYKVRETPYKRAMKLAKDRHQSLATEIEKFVEQYHDLYDYISR